MYKPVNVKVTDNTQDKLYDATFELLKDYAEDRWHEDTYVISFDDSIPAHLMKKLTDLTSLYPHDAVILTGNTVTFMNLGGHSSSCIAFEVNITKKTWKQTAQRFMRKLACHQDASEYYLKSIYTIYVLSGGSVSICDAHWAPTIISDHMPEEDLAVV